MCCHLKMNKIHAVATGFFSSVYVRNPSCGSDDEDRFCLPTGSGGATSGLQKQENPRKGLLNLGIIPHHPYFPIMCLIILIIYVFYFLSFLCNLQLFIYFYVMV